MLFLPCVFFLPPFQGERLGSPRGAAQGCSVVDSNRERWGAGGSLGQSSVRYVSDHSCFEGGRLNVEWRGLRRWEERPEEVGERHQQ